MGPSDLIPQEMSDYFGIPIYVVILLVFILGFITIRATQKFGLLKKELNSLDEIFLIVITGLAWIFRLFWGYQMLNPLVKDPKLFFSFWIVPAAALISIIVIIMVSIHDLEIILNRNIRRRTKVKNFSYFLLKKGEPYMPVSKVNRNIRNTNFIMVGYAVLFAITNIVETGQIGFVQVVASFLIIFSFSPIIMVTIHSYNYLTSQPSIIVND